MRISAEGVAAHGVSLFSVNLSTFKIKKSIDKHFPMFYNLFVIHYDEYNYSFGYFPRVIIKIKKGD